MVILAVDQVLKFASRVGNLAGADAELEEARDAFDRAAGSSAKAIRDLVVHLDAYAAGEGHRQLEKRRPKQQPLISDRSLETFL
jgi:hypothetical protein